jgi:glycosyltransferase involved in cell wall biosynthesis
MHILFLTQIIPYPPDAGPKVKTWHVLRYLSQLGYQITLVSFMRPEEAPHLDALRQVSTALHTIPIRRSRVADAGYWLHSQWTRRPFLVERDDSRAMRQLIEKLVASEQIDFIHADQLSMAQFALPPAHAEKWPATIFDAHNAVWTILDRMVQNIPWFIRPVVALEARRIKFYESMLVQAFDHTLAVTEIDHQALQQALRESNGTAKSAPDKITVVPIAVNTAKLLPLQRDPASKNILTLGTLHYPPNADGIRWFMNEVFPLVRQRVPDATLTIIGKNPPQDFLLAAEQHPGVINVTGYVPELDGYMEKAALVVVPVRAGGGMRVRILEAFARAMPVVTTTVGLEGISAVPDRDVLVKDTEAEFAEAVTQLLLDPSLQQCLAENGRSFVETHYDWQVILGKMNEVYQSLHPGP